MTTRDARGFTLLELLVVLVVLGIVLATITIAGGGGPERALRFEAERVAQLLSLAREEAQVTGTPVRFEADGERYRFLVRADRTWRVAADPDLRERRWDAPTQVRVERPDGRADVEFGRDAVDVPFRLRLGREGATVAIVANGLGRFAVE